MTLLFLSLIASAQGDDWICPANPYHKVIEGILRAGPSIQLHTCEQVRSSPTCQSLYHQMTLQGQDPQDYQLHCPEDADNWTEDQWAKSGEFFVGCALGEYDGIIGDLINDIMDESKCNHDLKRKKLLITAYNENIRPELRLKKQPSDAMLNSRTCSEIRTGLYNESRRISVTKKIPLHAPEPEGQSIFKKAKAVLKQKKIELQCYTPQRQARILCSAATVAFGAASGVVGLARLKVLAGLDSLPAIGAEAQAMVAGAELTSTALRTESLLATAKSLPELAAQPLNLPQKVTDLSRYQRDSHFFDTNGKDLITGENAMQNLKNGNYKFVIDEQGRVAYINRLMIPTSPSERAQYLATHDPLARALMEATGANTSRIVSAGEFVYRDGEIVMINNASGAFRPGTESLDFAKKVFAQTKAKIDPQMPHADYSRSYNPHKHDTDAKQAEKDFQALQDPVKGPLLEKVQALMTEARASGVTPEYVLRYVKENYKGDKFRQGIRTTMFFGDWTKPEEAESFALKYFFDGKPDGISIQQYQENFLNGIREIIQSAHKRPLESH